MQRHIVLLCLVWAWIFCGTAPALGRPEKMPPEDVVDVPAMGQGLCVSNLFQTKMVLQRNKPVRIWGWAVAGEKVTVSIAGLGVKGTIFHQGYNNCFNGTPGAIMYSQVFPEMITAWRAAFQDGQMPFGILSLCTEGSAQRRDNYVECMANVGPYIREAQYKTFLDFYTAGDKNIGFTSTYDLRRRWYHPQLKIPAGERIARWALATQYGFDREIRWKPPMVKEMKVEDDRIRLHMDEATANVDDGGSMEALPPRARTGNSIRPISRTW